MRLPPNKETGPRKGAGLFIRGNQSVVLAGDADKHIHQIAVRDAVLHGDPRTLAATLAQQGLWIAPKYRTQLIGYFNNLHVEERVTFAPRTGWHQIGGRQVFVLPDSAFGAKDLVLLNSAVSSPYGYRGTLTDWQNGIGRLTSGQRLGVLATSCAFAGPLLHLAGQDGGGIHFRAGSSVGKTSHLRAAASVWGPQSEMLQSWRATANGLEGAAVIRSDTLMALDELGVIESRELHAAVYQLAIGHGKSRARRDGSIRASAKWRVIVVSSGEVSIASKVEEDRGRKAKAGQEVRILDIPADAGTKYGAFDKPRDGESSAAGLADEIYKSAHEFYGTAGPAFLQAIIDHGIDKITDTINAAIEEFCNQVVALGTDGQIRRAARRLGLIAVAGPASSASRPGKRARLSWRPSSVWSSGLPVVVAVRLLRKSKPSARCGCSSRGMATAGSRAPTPSPMERLFPLSPTARDGGGARATIRSG
jgi:putative DNA primase/helicase